VTPREDPGPGSLDGEAWSVPRTEVKRAPGWVHVVGLLCVLSGPALFTVGLQWGDRSMDLPLSGNVRPGFSGFGMPKRWTCSAGHDHWSAPFWLGALVLTLSGTAVWTALARRFRR